MINIGTLLFKEVEDFDYETIDQTPLSVHRLIQEASVAETENLTKNIDSTLVDPTSKKCSEFRRGNQRKREQLEEEKKRLRDWDDFEKKVLTLEEQQDIEMIQLRKTLLPNQGFKRADKMNHEYIQMGTVVGDKLEGGKGFLKKKDKRQNLLEQFLQVDEHLGKTKDQYLAIQDKKMMNSKNKKWIKLKRAKQYKSTLKQTKQDFNFD